MIYVQKHRFWTSNLASSTGKLNLPPGIGRAGEAVARSYVINELGYEIVETNFRTQGGEIDIIAKTSSQFVFFEVKTRTNKSYGLGIEQISGRKAVRLQETAQRFLENHSADVDWRIDLLSIQMSKSGSVNDIQYIKFAIEEQT